MKTQKIFKLLVIIAVAGVLSAGAVGFYLFNMPHRDIQSSKTDFELTVASLVDEFLHDSNSANDKYLKEDEDSKILEVSGNVAKISKDYNENVVVILREPGREVGVSCTFLSHSEHTTSQIEVGQHIKVKGIIRSGAYYDEDLKMYEDVIMEKCDLVSPIPT